MNINASRMERCPEHGYKLQVAANTTTSTTEADVPRPIGPTQGYGCMSSGKRGAELESRHAAQVVGGEKFVCPHQGCRWVQYLNGD